MGETLPLRRPIRKLPESTVLKIAAGEVIERPASIVKELVENAIDAGAGRIEIRIAGGGLSSISVTDDGCGIPASEVPLALERHATSKLQNEDDLYRIETLGFRGEALASISAVSHLDLLTRTQDSASGLRVRAEGGEIRSNEPFGAPGGTSITVSNLFFNTPARKKFMRSKATEAGHIERVVRRIALSETGREFLLENEGEIVFHLPRAASPLERIRSLYGKDVTGNLTPFSGADGPVRAHGLISNARLTFGRPSEIWLFVNGRAIQDRMIQSAVLEGYRTALMERRYPMAFVFLEIAPREIDVNVHPTKAEVRFSNTQPIFRLVSGAIAQALRDIPAIVSDLPPLAPTQETFYRAPAAAASHPALAFARTAPASYASVPAPAALPHLEPTPGVFSSLEFLGTLDHTYLALKNEEAIFMIDQHAAHERVQFERLKKNAGRSVPDAQLLLVPVTFELTGEREAALDRILPLLSQLGFELEPFGAKTKIIRSVPAAIGHTDPRILLTDLADAVAADETLTAWQDHIDALLSRIACHSAVRAHDKMGIEQVRALLSAMDRIDLSTHCPHGRPTFLRFSVGDLERLFGRK